MKLNYGPKFSISKEIHADKYRQSNESFEEGMERIANALGDNKEHKEEFLDCLLNQRFLPAGRIQSAMGAKRIVTPYNCFVSGTIEDNSESIMHRAGQAFQTMRLGGGIGYDFSTLRPRGDVIKSLESYSSGPLSFMEIFDAVCGTVSSAGHRRGAQMGVLRIDHPDIEDFIKSKNNTSKFSNFNISVAVTDHFMDCLNRGIPFPLTFGGKIYRYVDPSYLWNLLMKSTWDWAEPGILFIDRINWKNNLYYCETISATNPCAEQPLPPFGACLLGSFNLVKYINTELKEFDYKLFTTDIFTCYAAMDNVIDVATYPLKEQELEAKNKRRMGLGVTGLANALEYLGYFYGSSEFLIEMEGIFEVLRDTTYVASMKRAKEKGTFPLYDKKILASNFIRKLPTWLLKDIEKYGLRNSHLLSIAPTGTISLSADNVSSGIEPVFSLHYDRTIREFDGERTERVEDYGYHYWGVKGKTTDKVTVKEHVDVLCLASKYVDSAVSKTCNIGDNVSYEEFKSVYLDAYNGGASGCTTFRSAGKRNGILNVAHPSDSIEQGVEQGTACFIDPETGRKTCD